MNCRTAGADFERRNSSAVVAETRTICGYSSARERGREEALRHLQRAFELEPLSVVANSRLGIGYTRMGRYDEAMSTFERTRERRL
jgi:Flp pilus assembly protein TadD